MKSETNWLLQPAKPLTPQQRATNPSSRVTPPNKTTNQNIDKEAATGEDKGADCILAGCVAADADAKSCCKRPRSKFKVFESQEKEKKRKRFRPCLENRRHVTPFVLHSDEKLKPSRKVSELNLQESGRSPVLKKCVDA